MLAASLRQEALWVDRNRSISVRNLSWGCRLFILDWLESRDR